MYGARSCVNSHYVLIILLMLITNSARLCSCMFDAYRLASLHGGLSPRREECIASSTSPALLFVLQPQHHGPLQ
ncbi:hypothetical protein ACQKWADRAFT_201596 [Trichoderma austrokoningii]